MAEEPPEVKAADPAISLGVDVLPNNSHESEQVANPDLEKEQFLAHTFPDLCPPDYVKDILKKVDRGTLENMVQYAKHRAWAAL